MSAFAEIQDLPLHEKLRLMEALWEGITPQETELEVLPWHKDLLDERERLIRNGTARFVDWETAKRQIQDAVS